MHRPMYWCIHVMYWCIDLCIDAKWHVSTQKAYESMHGYMYWCKMDFKPFCLDSTNACSNQHFIMVYLNHWCYFVVNLVFNLRLQVLRRRMSAIKTFLFLSFVWGLLLKFKFRIKFGFNGWVSKVTTEGNLLVLSYYLE